MDVRSAREKKAPTCLCVQVLYFSFTFRLQDSIRDHHFLL